MKTIKLSEWCDKTGISYLTAWRWFKKNKMPVYAYQTESGTILVEEEEEATIILDTNSNNIDPSISTFLKKTIEFNSNKSSVEEFAAYILSNFTLKLIGTENPKYSKNKPKTEEVRNHYKQMISNLKKEKPAPCMYFPPTDILENIEAEDEVRAIKTIVDTNELDNSNQGLVKQIHASDEDILVSINGSNVLKSDPLNVEDLQNALAYIANSSLGSLQTTGNTITYANLNSQNYTYSTNSISSSLGSSPYSLVMEAPIDSLYNSKPIDIDLINKPKRGRPKKGSFRREDV